MSDKDDKKGRDRSRGGDDKDGRDRRPPPERTGHVAPADPALVEFLEKLWTRENPPTRLEVWWVLGTNKDVRRDLVFYENFREDPERPWNVERCAKLAGEIRRAAQNWTDGKERKCSFELAIIDDYQQTAPLTKSIGPLRPTQAYAGVHPDGEPKGSDEDEDDGAIGIKPITHKYLTKMVRSMERMMTQTHAIVGDTMQLQQGIIVSQQAYVEKLQNADIALRSQNQELADRSLDREIIRDREKMKTRAIGHGLGIATTLAQSWFGAPAENVAGMLEDGSGGGGRAQPRRIGASKERSLCSSLLEQCAQEKVDIEFFGDWKDKESLSVSEIGIGHGLLKPGIFSPQQVAIFVGVATGQLPADALDALLPGQPHEITLEQMGLAGPMLTPPMVVAFQQIKSLRDEANEKAQQAGVKQGEAK